MIHVYEETNLNNSNNDNEPMIFTDIHFSSCFDISFQGEMIIVASK
jgi:hypothetical protein